MKVAFIGTLGHQGYAMSGVKSVEDCRVVALARSYPEEEIEVFLPQCEKFQTEAPKVYDDYREMLDREKPDVVSLAPRWHEHQQVSVECLKRDANVICEKPVAFTVEELAELREAYEQSKGDFIGQHGMRYTPNYVAGYRALKDGLIGKPILITSQKSYGFSLDRPEFYKQRETYGGTLCWVAVHALDWTYWMVGGFKTVYAAHTTIGNMGYGTCESSGVIAFELEQGGQGAINFDFLKAAKDPVRRDACRIAGEKGVIELKEERAHIVTHDEEPRELELPEDEPFFEEWVASIRGEGTCYLTAEDTFEVTRLALLALESADTGRLIRPEERPLG